MSASDRARWDARYAGPGYRMGDGPKALLRDLAPALPTAGRALDVACGEGQTAVWLAERGLTVDAVDISPVGLAKLAARAAAAGVADRVHAVEADLEQGLPRLEGPYDLVTCLHYRQPDLVPSLRSLLAPDGLLLVELPTVANIEIGLKAPSSRFLAGVGEVLALAGDLTVVSYREGVIDGRAVGQLLARRAPASPAVLRTGAPDC